MTVRLVVACVLEILRLAYRKTVSLVVACVLEILEIFDQEDCGEIDGNMCYLPGARIALCFSNLCFLVYDMQVRGSSLRRHWLAVIALKWKLIIFMVYMKTFQ
ncbi:hypothetical protein CEXT_183801 [Caerostris extrusa]|uniref:Secreted protein n=1 Tax=Caerostris extrusa TaxID=172846 RepID=A0AAV4MG38_CAEEX|nr:hypothetical protein CEXT_183801 [Caerostris extrusa]